MRNILGIAAVAALVAAVAGCSSERYYGPAYANPYAAPAYGYTYPPYSTRNSYDGYWDYQRNYKGIHSSPEFSGM